MRFCILRNVSGFLFKTSEQLENVVIIFEEMTC